LRKAAIGVGAQQFNLMDGSNADLVAAASFLHYRHAASMKQFWRSYVQKI
jgi:hypothetical protein